MKINKILILLLTSMGLQASHVRKLTIAGASAATAYPFLHAAYDWHNRKQHLNQWLHDLEDINPTLS